MENPDDLIRRFKDIIRLRGIRGMIGLQKILKMADLQGSGRITLPELKKALRDFRVENLQD